MESTLGVDSDAGIQKLEAAFRKPGGLYWEASGEKNAFPFLPRLAFSPNNVGWRPSNKGCSKFTRLLIGGSSHFQCENFYVVTFWDNLSDSSLILLALGFPTEVTQGLFLSIFYFLAHKIMNLTRTVLEYLWKIRIIQVYAYNIILQHMCFLCSYINRWLLHCMSKSR